MRAPKICSQEGCSTLTYDGASRCPEHHRRNGKWGPKVGTNRTATTAHKARRLRILRRDPMCQLGYAGYTGTSTICDHVIPLAAGAPDTDSNCQGVCRSCSDIATTALRAVVEHRDDLVKTRTQTVNRLHVVLTRLVLAGARRHLSADHAAEP